MNKERRFVYRNTDRKAIFVLLFFIVGGVLLTFVGSGDEVEDKALRRDSISGMTSKKAPFQRNSSFSQCNPTSFQSGNASDASRQAIYYKVEERKPELFFFDPNTADSTDLLRLGLQPWQVRNIYKYRAKGGIYRKPDDFARLYGLTVKQYRALKPFIRISPDFLPASTLVKDTVYVRDTLRYPQKIKPSERIVLNAADTTILKKVPGIGSYYARSIVAYGERLGGYVNVNQLDEIGDFPSEAKQYFIIQNPTTRRLNLNTASLAELRKHPYIGFHRAKAIVDYRRTKGNIASLDEMRLNRDFTPDVIERLRPYVTY